MSAGDWSFVGDASLASLPVTGTTKTIPFPGGLQEGDLLVAWIVHNDLTAPAAPSGWQIVENTMNGYRFCTYLKVADSTDVADGEVVFTTTNAYTLDASVQAWRPGSNVTFDLNTTGSNITFDGGASSTSETVTLSSTGNIDPTKKCLSIQHHWGLVQGPTIFTISVDANEDNDRRDLSSWTDGVPTHSLSYTTHSEENVTFQSVEDVFTTNTNPTFRKYSIARTKVTYTADVYPTKGLVTAHSSFFPDFAGDEKYYVYFFDPGTDDWEVPTVGDPCVLFLEWSYANPAFGGYGVDAYVDSDDITFSGTSLTEWTNLPAIQYLSTGGNKISVTAHYTTNLRDIPGFSDETMIELKPSVRVALYGGLVHGLHSRTSGAVWTAAAPAQSGTVEATNRANVSATTNLMDVFPSLNYFGSPTDSGWAFMMASVNGGTGAGGPTTKNGWFSQFLPFEGFGNGRMNSIHNDGSANAYDPGCYEFSNSQLVYDSPTDGFTIREKSHNANGTTQAYWSPGVAFWVDHPASTIDVLSTVATIDHDLLIGVEEDQHHAKQHGLASYDHTGGFMVKSGFGPQTMSDADFTTTPVNGQVAMTFDTQSGRKLYWVRAGGTWDPVEVSP